MGENETPAATDAPGPEDARASSSSLKGMPPIRTSSRSGRRVSGSTDAEKEADQRRRASMRLRNPLDGVLDRRRQVVRERRAEQAASPPRRAR